MLRYKNFNFIILIVFMIGFSYLSIAQNQVEIKEVKALNRASYDLREVNINAGLEMNLQAMSQAEKINNDTLNALIYSARGVLYTGVEQYDSASIYTMKSLKLREKIGDIDGVGKSYTNQGTIFFESEQYEKAKEYYTKSLEIKLELNDNWRLPGVFNNIGNCHLSLGNFDSAIYFYKKGLNYEDGNPSNLSDNSLNLSNIYNELDRPNEALLILQKLLPKLKNGRKKGVCLHNLGISYEKLEQYDSSLFYYNLTIPYGDMLGGYKLKKDLKKSQLILLLKINENTEILNNFHQYNILNDSLTEQIINSNIADIEAQYQVEKKDAEITNQNIQIELKEEKNKLMKAENEQYTLTIIALLTLLVIIAILIVFVTRYYRQKRKLAGLELERKKHEIEHLMQGYELNLFEAQNFGQQEERQRIARDLHDRLGGLLAAVNLQIESLAFTQKAVTSEELRKIKAMVSDGISEVRNVSHNMQAEALKRHGLKGALKAISKSINDSKKLKVDLYLEDLGETNGSELEREVYKIIMELISNTLKHAKANLITLQINEINHELMVVYEDDGIGFSTDPTQSNGLGMGSINSRVKKLKGNWQIDSHPNKGTTIIINIPTL